jgi:serine-type D-Ala-D-Ala carboxypeptidase (penicillin-binding protein 5/6)
VRLGALALALLAGLALAAQGGAGSRVARVAASSPALAGSQAPRAPHPDAREWLVENAATGEVLTSHDADVERPIASITKLMTVLVALDHHELTDVVRVDPRVTRVGQESADLRAGELLTVHDLIEAALIQSANDAADALALSVSPDFESFAVLMNQKARELGLTHSTFVRPDGLDAPGEESTAADVMLLARAAMAVPFIRETVRMPEASISGGRTLHTWNDLLGEVPGVYGVKTGHTDEAGWSQVAAIRGDGVSVYATILGSPSRAQRNADLEVLLEWGLAQYRVVEAISGTRRYAWVQLPYGRAPLGLVATKPLKTVARVTQTLVERVVAPVAISLPVARGQVLGRVQVWSGAKLVGERPLVASRSVSKPGLGGRISFYSGRTAHHLVGLFS